MRFRILLLTLLILLVSAPAAHAQAIIPYGSSSVGSISSTAPLAFFTFNGTAGDRVTVNVIGITPGFDPAVSLLSPAQQQIANNNNDPTSLGTTDARVTITLAETGIHTILVSSVGGVPGDFLVRLFGEAAAPTTDVGDDGTNTTVSGTRQVFSFAADPDAPLVVNVSTTTPGFDFQAATFSPNGQPLAVSTGSNLVGVSLSVPPGTGIYTVEVTPLDPGINGDVQVSVTAVGEPITAPGEILATEEPDEEPDTDDGDEQPQPATSTPVPLLTETPIPNQNQQQATATATASPVQEQDQGDEQQPTATVIPSATASAIPQQDQQVQPSATFTPSYTPTVPPTATYTPSYTPTTPPAAQIAPEDARFNNPLNIPLDTTVSVLDFVSYPGGDREDRVRWDITGMNQNASVSGGQARLVISVSCFGQNTDQIQFFTGGQTFGCGQTIVDQEVTFNSKTGSVVITAVGGEGTYVQWVLTGTATRIN